MALDPHFSAAFEFNCEVEAAYAGLVQAANSDPGSGWESGLGGNLLYAGELDEAGRVLVVAANIAGAASLAATADQNAQKQAIRDGIVDFLVTSLDEALRILKNEIRKRETVAVCVGMDPAVIEREMLQRGVVPDLLRPGAPFTANIGAANWVSWRVAAEPAQWLPRLDSIAADCLHPADFRGRRWLRLAPRYLGRLSRGVHSLQTDREFASAFVELVRREVASGKIGVPVEIQSRTPAGEKEFLISPERSASE